MRALEVALKAAGDPTRTRILKLLETGGLCVCQIQAVLGLAASTVSKHLAILKAAGLVNDRRDGKWIEYGLSGAADNPFAAPLLAMLRGALDRDPRIVADSKRLQQIRRIPLDQLCSTGLTRPTTRSKHPPHLLFVCVENSCRSQMAEGFARALGGARVTVASAGSRPSGQVNPRAVRFMDERGITLDSHVSKGLHDIPADVVWDYVVTMGCGDACPFVPARHRIDWDLPDPKALDDAGFRAVRDRIEGLVRDLLRTAGVAS